ncbi:DUF5958 family protein [Streptomyces sp. NPDC001675]
MAPGPFRASGGQARAREEDVPESIARSGIRPTHTSAAMLTKWRFGMEGLPAHELTKSFCLLVALFSIADTRRRALHCADGCGQAWHNLLDPPRDATWSVFLPWVLPGILMSWVFPAQERWARAPGGRRWSSLATVERPRTAQGRPSIGALD